MFDPPHEEPMSVPTTDRVTPTLPSRDLAATSAFYARLGFHEQFRDGGWLIVARGALQLEFFPHPELDPWQNYAGACLRVSDARALHDAFAAAGLSTSPRDIPRLQPPRDEPFGFRQFFLVDADGNLLRGLEPLR
jgi:catechol 2,3-dioxygenase-like lactoylglutathione lyase family enzyme